MSTIGLARRIPGPLQRVFIQRLVKDPIPLRLSGATARPGQPL
jgi:hypothetical protein